MWCFNNILTGYRHLSLTNLNHIALLYLSVAYNLTCGHNSLLEPGDKNLVDTTKKDDVMSIDSFSFINFLPVVAMGSSSLNPSSSCSSSFPLSTSFSFLVRQWAWFVRRIQVFASPTPLLVSQLSLSPINSFSSDTCFISNLYPLFLLHIHITIQGIYYNNGTRQTFTKMVREHEFKYI